MGCSHTNLYLFLLCYTAPSAPVLDVFYTSRTEHGFVSFAYAPVLDLRSGSRTKHDLFLLLMRRFLIREADQEQSMACFLVCEADQDYIFLDTAQGNHYICIRQ